MTFATTLTGYHLFLIPPRHDQGQIYDLMKKLSEEFPTPSFIPHVTLHGPIYLPLEELVQRLEKHRFKRPLLRMEGVGESDFYWRCVYLIMQQSEDLMQLNQMCRAEFGIVYDEPYFPHLSLVYGIEDAQVRAAIKNRVRFEEEVSWVAEEIAVMEVTDKTPEEWEVVAKIKL